MKPYFFERHKIAKAQIEDRRDGEEKKENKDYYEIDDSECEVTEDEDQ
ncbi:MAG: hypothetical protein VB031_02090 [Eubacteriaceae bacterium]|nr:hypothetical protein [Eubacteriaceae bacterium]